MSNENTGSVDIMSTGDKPKTELVLVKCMAKEGIGDKQYSDLYMSCSGFSKG